MKIYIWPDGVFCFDYELEEFLSGPNAKSDDFEIIEDTTSAWDNFWTEYDSGSIYEEI